MCRRTEFAERAGCAEGLTVLKGLDVQKGWMCRRAEWAERAECAEEPNVLKGLDVQKA